MEDHKKGKIKKKWSNSLIM